MNETPEPVEGAREDAASAQGAVESGGGAPTGESALAAAWRVTKQIIRGSLHSPLLKYLGYSLVIHVLVIAALSGAVLALPTGGDDEVVASDVDTDAATAEIDADESADLIDPNKPTGSADDYYKKQGGGKAASLEDIPKAPSIDVGLD